MFKWRQSHLKEMKPSDNFSNRTSKPGSQPWVNNGPFTLNIEHKSILESNEWLTNVTFRMTSLTQLFKPVLFYSAST